MVDYVALRSVAEELIEANGREVSLIFMSQDSATVDQPWRGPHEDEETALDLIGVFDIDEGDDSNQTIVQRGSRKLVIAASSLDALVENHEPPLTIENISFVEDHGERWRVVEHEVVGPGDYHVYYELRLEK
jgi:hypothetical protein